MSSGYSITIVRISIALEYTAGYGGVRFLYANEIPTTKVKFTTSSVRDTSCFLRK